MRQIVYRSRNDDPQKDWGGIGSANVANQRLSTRGSRHSVTSVKPILGLVGGIGSGKSAVAAELAKHGGAVINADQFGHEALGQPEIRRQVVIHFGKNILDAEGAIDRKKLGAKVFADVKELRALETIVFPFIGRRIREEIDRSRRRAEVRFVVLD